ncbi:MAG: cation diffusion facilitator family transporter [Verrucomicrobiia bacterium]|jgi:cation diffusion facilitator family transporter
MVSVETGLRASAIGIVTNFGLAIIKVVVGVVGNSYALIADGIESTTDIVSSFIVWSGLRIASRPPDADHPYGHGKAESIAGVIVAAALLGAATLIAWQSVGEIRNPHGAPAWFTLVTLVLVIVVKETLFRFVNKTGQSLESTALKGDAWHHRSDALTSAAVFVGISVALIGGEGYEGADDWAALFACGIIAFNGIRLLRPALSEVMDGAVEAGVQEKIRAIAGGVSGVAAIEKCRVRKSGLGLCMDIHVEVDGRMTVTEGHDVAHRVKDALTASELRIADVVVHIEPSRPATK